MWMPDKQDEEDMEREFKGPIMLSGRKLTSQLHAVPLEVLDKIRAGKPLEGNEKQYVASSAESYAKALKKLLFTWQESLKIKCPDLLEADGRLHLRQFWSFRSPKFIGPCNIMQFLDEDSFDSRPATKRLALEAYNHLLDFVSKKLQSVDTFNLFLQPLTEEEQTWDHEKRQGKARKKIQELINDVRNTKYMMTIGNPHGRWEGEREGMNQMNKDNAKYFVGTTIPNPSEILPVWFNHPETKAMDKKLFDYAETGRTMSGSEILQMCKYLLTRFFCKQGMRTEIGRIIKWSDYSEAKQRSFAAFPYKQVQWDTSVDPRNPKVQQRIFNDENLYIREDPYKPDPNDPDDDMKNPVWDAVKGYCVVIRLHKTGYKFPAYIWFSLIDDARMACWEQVCSDYLNSIGKTKTIETPIFINSRGESLLASTTSLDLSDFARIVKIPAASVYMFRKMFTNFVYDSRSGKLANIISIFFKSTNVFFQPC